MKWGFRGFFGYCFLILLSGGSRACKQNTKVLKELRTDRVLDSGPAPRPCVRWRPFGGVGAGEGRMAQGGEGPGGGEGEATTHTGTGTGNEQAPPQGVGAQWKAEEVRGVGMCLCHRLQVQCRVDGRTSPQTGKAWPRGWLRNHPEAVF